MGRSARVGMIGALLAVAIGGSAAAARAVPLVRIDGGIGVPGGTAQAVLSLADDPTGEAVSGTFGIDFPAPPLSAGTTACTIAERVSGTHQLATDAPEPGRLELTIAPLSGSAPLGDGELASCTFGIALGTPAGTAALTLAAEVTDAAGEPVAVAVQNGAIIIDAARPTATVTTTPTITLTPTVTRTPTLTPIPIPSDTPTSTPTATRFVPVVIADNVGGCAVGPSGGSALPLLAALAALLAHRRRPPAL